MIRAVSLIWLKNEHPSKRGMNNEKAPILFQVGAFFCFILLVCKMETQGLLEQSKCLDQSLILFFSNMYDASMAWSESACGLCGAFQSEMLEVWRAAKLEDAVSVAVIA